jgi:hypothetical protein
MFHRVVWKKPTTCHRPLLLSLYATQAHIALMMKAASTSETSVNSHQTTRRNIPE